MYYTVEERKEIKQMFAKIHKDVLDFVENDSLKLFLRVMQSRCKVNYFRVIGSRWEEECVSFNQQPPHTWVNATGWVEYAEGWKIPLYVCLRDKGNYIEKACTLLHELGIVSIVYDGGMLNYLVGREERLKLLNGHSVLLKDMGTLGG